jgi:hypothetical protein
VCFSFISSLCLRNVCRDQSFAIFARSSNICFLQARPHIVSQSNHPPVLHQSESCGRHIHARSGTELRFCRA